MARGCALASHSRMPDALDPIAFALRLVGAFYVFAGFVAGRAALMSAMLDTALAGLTMKPVAVRERALSIWLIASAWLVFASGVLLMVLSQEAVWAFVLCALSQGFYLTIAAPYYFDLEDPPDPQGRRQTTNAFFLYLAATLAVIWASGRYLTPIADLPLLLNVTAWSALGAFAAYMIWHSISATRIPSASPGWQGVDQTEGDFSDPAKPFDPRLTRITLSRDGGASPLKNEKTGADVDLQSLPVSDSLRAKLLDWFRDGDPDMIGSAYTLAERLAHECTDIAVAEPGVPNSYFRYAFPTPYADPQTGAANWDRMSAVKIMCDHDCHPVWAANEGVVGDFPPQALAISSALEDALLDWQDRYDASFNPRDPTQPKWSAEDILAHERDGFELARRVKAERPEITVLVHSARGVLTVEAGMPPSAWRLKDA